MRTETDNMMTHSESELDAPREKVITKKMKRGAIRSLDKVRAKVRNRQAAIKAENE